MQTDQAVAGSPVQYPSAPVGDRFYQFRFTKSAKFMLEAWGFDLAPGRSIPALAWAAAMAGQVDAAGKWKSAGFKNPVEFTDLLGDDDDLAPLYEAVTNALKKAAPRAQVTLTPQGSESTSTN